ncbi:ABC-type uncharacterized transport system ATPase component [Bartonella callosciuri]|uniref:ABC-type uncharacterized transport system ATPase component n=1 Tax=Bartonella callosciuri TaxID=686223 RepID=A0A840NUU1_9HYPH|nr:ABC-type uncharacterized transport system ATPase component [Bartonella callosciuri]
MFLLLDEHTSALDPGMANFVLRLTEKIVEEKKLTTIMVMHSMRQVLDYGDRKIDVTWWKSDFGCVSRRM